MLRIRDSGWSAGGLWAVRVTERHSRTSQGFRFLLTNYYFPLADFAESFFFFFYICGNLGAWKLFKLAFSCCVEALENLKTFLFKNMIRPELC